MIHKYKIYFWQFKHFINVETKGFPAILNYFIDIVLTYFWSSLCPKNENSRFVLVNIEKNYNLC